MASARLEPDCPLCGHRFAEGPPTCVPCPLKHGNAACHDVVCPRCGYERSVSFGAIGALRGIACELKAWLRRSTAGL